MIKKLRYRIFAPLLLVIGVVASHNAYAFPCEYGFVSGESGTYSCQDGTNKSDWDDLDGLKVFGKDDWVPITKIDKGVYDQPVDVDFAVTVESNLYEGTWSFADALYGTYTDAVIVLKDGLVKDGFDQQWSAYLVPREDNGINLSQVVGLWNMGTECIDADPACLQSIPRQISHISLYARIDDGSEPPAAVPEPSILALIGISLVGVGVFRRRR